MEGETPDAYPSAISDWFWESSEFIVIEFNIDPIIIPWYKVSNISEIIMLDWDRSDTSESCKTSRKSTQRVIIKVKSAKSRHISESLWKYGESLITEIEILNKMKISEIIRKALENITSESEDLEGGKLTKGIWKEFELILIFRIAITIKLELIEIYKMSEIRGEPWSCESIISKIESLKFIKSISYTITSASKRKGKGGNPIVTQIKFLEIWGNEVIW